MRISISGKGIHRREVPGVEKLRNLPPEWYAFTNLELVQPGSMPPQIDIAMVLSDRIIIADLKDWHGRISSDGDRWFENDRYVDTSPVKKILNNVRILASLLARYLSKNAATAGNSANRPQVPLIEGCVILTGRCDIRGLAELEKPRVFMIDEFCRIVRDNRELNRKFAQPKWIDKAEPLTASDSKWRDRLATFFGAAGGYFRPLDKRYGTYRAVSDCTFKHPRDLYTEYDAEEVGAGRAFGLLRLWDFSKAETRYASEESRIEIADREQHVIAYLVDRQPDLETILIRPKTSDPSRGIHYWEVFERRRQLQRLRDFMPIHASELSPNARIDLARTLLAHVAAMHRLEAAHLDLGPHSIWIELPSSIRLSHLVAASYPQIESLGERRYEFLAGGTVLPERVLGQELDHLRKDVFLLGTVIHAIIFGSAPKCKTAGDPPTWDAGIDPEGRFGDLHDWFEKSLDVSFLQRFENAQGMLDAFNSAAHSYSGQGAAIDRLQRFRRWKSVFELSRAFPMTRVLKETDRIVAWRAEVGGRTCLVKTWRRSCWGEEAREAPRLLTFCETAEDLILARPPGLVPLLDVGYLVDHLVLVQEFVEALNLTEDLERNPSEWQNLEITVEFIGRLARVVVALHGGGWSHGDLKPSNILVKRVESGREPLLVDVMDFGPEREGEIVTPAYSPRFGTGTRERDRYAVLKIAEELLGVTRADNSNVELLKRAISRCRDGPPALATLDPLIETIEHVGRQREEPAKKTIVVRAPNVRAGLVVPDEGQYYVWVKSSANISITGAAEEIALTLDPRKRKVVEMRREFVSQSRIALAEKRATSRLFDEIIIETGLPDFKGLSHLVAVPPPKPPVPVMPVPSADTEEPVVQPRTAEGEGVPEICLDEDAIADIEREPEPPISIDVPALWRTLLEIEKEQFTEVVAQDDSYYSRERRRHFISFQGRKGTIDFSREDKVVVELATKSKGWVPIGILDLDLTSGDALAVDASLYRAGRSGVLCAAGSELRFNSMMEGDSRSRREAATLRLLTRRAVVPDLIDYFSLASASLSKKSADSVNIELVRARYGLNPSQAEAFANLWSRRPLGLLQGPPGTGKTKFIAALVHHALSAGLVRNVLLASQSHEAVNNAAESVLKLFREDGVEPSLVRVGQEGYVSEPLKPYHSAKIESHYREQFKAGMKQRFQLAGRYVGVPEAFADDLFAMEATVWPIFMRLQAVLTAGEVTSDDDVRHRRLSALRRTLLQLEEKLGIAGTGKRGWTDPEAYDLAISDIVGRHEIESPEQIRRMRAVATLARDWIGSVSSRHRSFEEFLANTRHIVSGTCVGLGKASLGLSSARFDLVVVDEAARCTPSELAVPVQAGRWILLVGDHLQLEPFHQPAVIREAQRKLILPTREIIRSDFERLFESAYGTAVGETLRIQYRMLPEIGRLVSAVFYGGKLKHERTVPIIPPEACSGALKSQLLWISTDSLGEEAFQSQPRGGKSLVNDVEANIIADTIRRLEDNAPFVEWVASQGEERKPIGIICTYKAQRELIRRKLRASGISGTMLRACRIDTVDSYQGKENPIVILSLVRNNADGAAEAGRRTIAQGYMARGNRINVALSRAMDRLIIVGAFDRWPSNSPMGQVSATFEKLAKQQSAEFTQAVDVKDKGKAARRKPKLTSGRRRQSVPGTSHE